MRRRDFLGVLGATLWPLPISAQQPAPPKIGYLGLTSASGERDFTAALRKGLKEAGFDEGRNVSIEFRFAEGDVSRLSALCAELVKDNVAVIFTGTTVAAKEIASAIPIVFAIGADPIRSGLVSSLNRPGDRMTGISFFTNQMEGKRLGLLQEIAQKAASLAVLLNPNNPFFDNQLKDVMRHACLA